MIEILKVKPNYAFLFSFAFLAATAWANPGTPDEVIARLRAIPLKDELTGVHGDEFFDMHGNAIEELQGLMKLRFEATSSICRELDKPGPATRYTEALYDVLAFVKDPAAIPWFKGRLKKDEALTLRESLVGERWRTRLYGAGHEELKWLHEPEKWAAFYRRLILAAGSDQERIALERVLAGWFHDRETIAFFARLKKTASVQSEELLCAQLYLRQHKLTYDPEKTKACLAALRSSAAGRKTLLEYADQLRDPVFVPWLIEIVEPAGTKVEVGNAQWILQEITFCRGVSGRSGWSRWWDSHKNDSRAYWIAAAMTEIEKLAATDPEAAHEILDKSVYYWKDRAALPHVKKLIGPPELASNLVGWINLSYHPAWREDLRPLADQIIQKNQKVLQPWAIGLLEGLDFLPHQNSDWKDYVAQSNLNL